ncbi:hypothetical protein HDU92_002554 [Lobulomyces angularis]|nr:hypothetical protein HDU92_002554 [Lobulomyces angularis]
MINYLSTFGKSIKKTHTQQIIPKNFIELNHDVNNRKKKAVADSKIVLQNLLKLNLPAENAYEQCLKEKKLEKPDMINFFKSSKILSPNKMLNDFKKLNYTVDSTFHSAFFQACLNQNEIALATRHAVEHKNTLSDSNKSELVEVLAKSGHSKATSVIINNKMKNVTIDDINNLLEVEINFDNADSAVKYVNETFSSKYNLTPNLRSFQIILKHFSEKGDQVSIINIFKLIESKYGSPVDLFSWSEILKCFCKRRNFLAVDTYLRKFEKSHNKLSLSPETFEGFIELYGKNSFIKGLNSFYELEKIGGKNLQPVRYTPGMVGKLLNVYLTWDDMLGAWKLYRQLCFEDKVDTPLEAIFNLAKSHLGKHSDYLRDMIKFSSSNLSIEDSDVLVAGLMESLIWHNDGKGALELFDQYLKFKPAHQIGSKSILSSIKAFGLIGDKESSLKNFEKSLEICNQEDLSLRNIMFSLSKTKNFEKLSSTFNDYKKKGYKYDNDILSMVQEANTEKEFCQEWVTEGYSPRVSDKILDNALIKNNLTLLVNEL